MSYHVYYNGRISIGPPLTEQDAATVAGFLKGEQNEIYNTASQAYADMEDLWPAEMLTVSADRGSLLPVEDESRHGLNAWLRLAVELYLSPKGYTVNGEIRWEGSESSDRGAIFVKDGAVEAIDDIVFNPGPSWCRTPHVSDDIASAVNALLDSADSAGCSDDLTVVESAAVERLRFLLPQC